MGSKDGLKELEKDLKIALALKDLLTKRKDRIRTRLRYLMEEGTYEPSVREDKGFVDEFSNLISESRWTSKRLDLVEQAIKEIHKRMDAVLTKSK